MISVATEDNKSAIESAVELLMKNIENYLDFYINNKGIFILIAILENSEFAEKLKEMLIKKKSSIDAKEETSGIRILKSKLLN